MWLKFELYIYVYSLFEKHAGTNHGYFNLGLFFCWYNAPWKLILWRKSLDDIFADCSIQNHLFLDEPTFQVICFDGHGRPASLLIHHRCRAKVSPVNCSRHIEHPSVGKIYAESVNPQLVLCTPICRAFFHHSDQRTDHLPVSRC